MTHLVIHDQERPRLNTSLSAYMTYNQQKLSIPPWASVPEIEDFTLPRTKPRNPKEPFSFDERSCNLSTPYGIDNLTTLSFLENLRLSPTNTAEDPSGDGLTAHNIGDDYLKDNMIARLHPPV